VCFLFIQKVLLSLQSRLTPDGNRCSHCDLRTCWWVCGEPLLKNQRPGHRPLEPCSSHLCGCHICSPTVSWAALPMVMAFISQSCGWAEHQSVQNGMVFFWFLAVFSWPECLLVQK
jgi:Pyruvate/2-oxoacid:ferredoxin oxidoreductase delta subunit